MALNLRNIDLEKTEKITLLAKEIFRIFPESVSGLVFNFLDCGCVYYQRKFIDGDIDRKFGIYRNIRKGPCEVCMTMDEKWKERVVYETVVYNSKIEMG